MVDQAVEMGVVIADGQQLTINQCNNPDCSGLCAVDVAAHIAVLLNYNFKVHPTVPMNVYAF